MNLYRVFVYWICDDPEYPELSGERGLDTIFEAEDDSVALDFGKAWTETRSFCLDDAWKIKKLACVKLGRWFPGGFRKGEFPEAGANSMPFFEWKYDWMTGFTFPVAIESEKKKILIFEQENKRIANEARWFNKWANRLKGWKWSSS